MSAEHTLAEERFFELMKRLRKLGLDTQPLDAAVSPAQMSLLDWIAASPGCGA